MDQFAVAESLSLWSLWSRQDTDGVPLPPTCRSAESHYQGEAGDLFVDLVDRETDAPVVPDVIGLRVERAVLQLDQLHREAIVLRYVRRLPLAIVAKRLHVDDARPLLEQAHAALAHRLAA